MIHKLKRKFTVLATVSMFLLMAVLVLIMNIVNYSSVIGESDEILDVLSQPGAPFGEDRIPPVMVERINDFISRGMSPEVPFEARYFTVTVTSDGKIRESDLSRIISVDEAAAEEYIAEAVNSSRERGFIDQFRYLKVTDKLFSRIIFLDCGRKLSSFCTFMKTSIAVGFSGCVAVFVLFMLISGRIVRPIAEGYEKQKRFISDAGHEIKTPLTIISANVDLLESEGEKEELTDIRHEVLRLTELTGDLVLLSKMEEAAKPMLKIDFPVSDLTSETVDSFRAPIAAKNLQLTSVICPSLTLHAAPDAVRRLISILMDNAIKYSADGGDILVSLQPFKKNIQLTVTNMTAEPVLENELANVFDRFYRTDASRNSVTGGHGIGLSLAKAITDAHGGTITASTRSGFDFSVTAVFPCPCS